jgi:hypothetical protein
MALTALNLAYVSFGPSRLAAPHLVRFEPGLSGHTLCGLPAVGYGAMQSDEPSAAEVGAMCPQCQAASARPRSDHEDVRPS